MHEPGIAHTHMAPNTRPPAPFQDPSGGPDMSLVHLYMDVVGAVQGLFATQTISKSEWVKILSHQVLRVVGTVRRYLACCMEVAGLRCGGNRSVDMVDGQA